jgi:hypothetical protein
MSFTYWVNYLFDCKTMVLILLVANSWFCISLRRTVDKALKSR